MTQAADRHVLATSPDGREVIVLTRSGEWRREPAEPGLSARQGGSEGHLLSMHAAGRLAADWTGAGGSLHKGPGALRLRIAHRRAKRFDKAS